MINQIVKMAVVSWVILAAFCVNSAKGQTPASEYEVKAAFLYNFIKFVEWPAQSLPAKDTPYVIGVLGTDPFFDAETLVNYLDLAVNGKMINERKLIVRRENRMVNLKGCHLVFINKSERGRLKEIVAVAHENNILTVSEAEEFCQQGGIINFVKQSGKVRFEINPAAAAQSNLKISSKLLSVAKIVSAQPR